MTTTTAQDTTIPLPRPSTVSGPYWDGCRRGQLLVQRCTDCATFVFPPEAFCTACLGPDLEWTESAGEGVVYSFSTVWRPQQPAFEVPYVVAAIALDEGWYTFTNVIDCAPEDVHIGMRVRAKFVVMSDTITLPYFAPIPGAPPPGA